jgi:peptide-methionine (S)-S-oxide reductase
METVTLAGGCFWCLEAAYQEINGVTQVDPGYAGGQVDSPTYEQVMTSETGHAESVQVTFDTKIISLDDILDIFWALHDPTTLNRAGNDVGTEYRSIIFYTNDEQEAAAEKSIAEVAKLWPNPIVTELVPLEKFWPAEEYHRNYFKNHPDQAYCQIIINPKLVKLRQKFNDKLKVSS